MPELQEIANEKQVSLLGIDGPVLASKYSWRCCDWIHPDISGGYIRIHCMFTLLTTFTMFTTLAMFTMFIVYLVHHVKFIFKNPFFRSFHHHTHTPLPPNPHPQPLVSSPNGVKTTVLKILVEVKTHEAAKHGSG